MVRESGSSYSLIPSFLVQRLFIVLEYLIRLFIHVLLGHFFHNVLEGQASVTGLRRRNLRPGARQNIGRLI